MNLSDDTITRRTMILFLLAMLAASPLMWMSVDPNAGNTMLALTSGSKAQTSFASGSTLLAPVR